MRDFAILFVHLIVTLARLLRPGGHRAIITESLLLKHQLAILNRSQGRAPNLRPMDRVIAGLCAGFIRPTRLMRSAIALKPSAVLGFHLALVKRKYRRLFTPRRGGKPGPKGLSAELNRSQPISPRINNSPPTPRHRRLSAPPLRRRRPRTAFGAGIADGARLIRAAP